MSGCPPLPLLEAYKACAYLASRLKKGHGVSHRDISGLMDRGAYISEATTWSDTPGCAGRWWWMAGDGGLHMADDQNTNHKLHCGVGAGGRMSNSLSQFLSHSTC